MPYSVEPRATPKYDKRIKIQKEEHIKIKALHKEGTPIRAIARQYGVDKRLIQFILFPERKQKNNQSRLDNGGWKQYYNKKKHLKYSKKHRDHLKELRKEGKI